MDDVAGLIAAILGLGLESRDLGIVQMGLRAAIVYAVTLLIVRLAKKRFMGRATAFDVILGIMLGSVVSRAITGNAPIAPALAAAAVLVGMHWAFSGLAVRWHGFGALIKGGPRLLVRDGTVDAEAMKRAHMTEHDLNEDLRGKSVFRIQDVSEARLERNGQLSVRKKGEPKVIEIAVEAGVKTVRVEIG